MQKFHIIRASLAKPFVEELIQAGVDVHQLAREADLPLSAVLEDTDGVIGEFALWRFIESGARQAHCPLLGYQSAGNRPVDGPSNPDTLPLRLGATLEQTLAYFTEDAMQFSTASYYSLDRREGNCWFRRAQAFGRGRASWQVELYAVTLLIQIIRLHAGDDWLPTAIRFSAAESAQALPDEWNGIAQSWGQDATGVHLSEVDLLLPAKAERPSRQTKTGETRRPTLAELIETQIRCGTIGIDNAARQLGLSRSTLQRYLRSHGTSYQGLLEEVRKSIACDLLKHSALPIRDIADMLGYTHLGNFTRAFIQWTGSSPTTFRREPPGTKTATASADQ